MNTYRLYRFMYLISLLITIEAGKEHFSNYTDANASCLNRGGLITQELLKLNGLSNMTGELAVNNGMFKDREAVWVQGQAQTGPYIALHTCMMPSNQDKHSFARKMTFNSNILYECSVLCGQMLHSGYLGIYHDSCFCMYDTFRFPYTPQCLENDFMDIQNRIIVFRLIKNVQFGIQSKSDFNCLGASFQENGITSYFSTKCASTFYSICTQRVDSDLSNKCLPRLGEFCFNEKNGTLLENYRNCWLYNGTLIPFNSGTPIFSNYPVMLGSFRAFKAIDYDSENSGNVKSCLSITHCNGTIHLETENCSNRNAFICMDDIQETSNKDESETTDTVSNFILPFLLILIIIVILIAIAVCWKSGSTSLPVPQVQPDEPKTRCSQSDSLKQEEKNPLNLKA